LRYAPHLWGKCADCSLGRATSVGQGKHVPCKDRMVDGFADSDVGAEDALGEYMLPSPAMQHV